MSSPSSQPSTSCCWIVSDIQWCCHSCLETPQCVWLVTTYTCKLGLIKSTWLLLINKCSSRSIVLCLHLLLWYDSPPNFCPIAYSQTEETWDNFFCNCSISASINLQLNIIILYMHILQKIRHTSTSIELGRHAHCWTPGSGPPLTGFIHIKNTSFLGFTDFSTKYKMDWSYWFMALWNHGNVN